MRYNLLIKDMKKAIRIFGLLLLLCELPSCKKKLEANAYGAFVSSSENGLKKTVSIDGWEYVIQYKPYDYILLMEHISGQDRKKRLQQLSGTAWFNISIKRKDGSVSPMRYNLSSKDEYDKRLNYFLNGAAKDIGMVYGNKDTLMPLSYAFENNYNLTPQETMVVAFALPKGEISPAKEMKISIDDNVFGNGIIKAVITTDALQNTPELIE